MTKSIPQKSTHGNLTSGSIPKHVLSIALPASIGNFFYTMFNVVDTYYADTISTQAIAALSLAFPAYFILLAVCTGISSSITALTGTELGQGSTRRGALFVMQGITLGIVLSIFVGIFGLLVQEALFRSLGASGEYLDLCLEYMSVIFYAAPFFVAVYCINGALYSLGNTRPQRNFLITSFVLNCILDPLFIRGFWIIPPMGIFGIALATALVQVVGVVYLAWELKKTGLLQGTHLRDYLPVPECILALSRQGAPSAANFATVGLGIYIITYFISWFGQDAVAGYGIATRIEQIALMPALGLHVATLSLTAQNNGAKKPHRAWEALKTAYLFGAYVIIPASILIYLLAPQLVSIFTSATEVIAHGAHYLSIAAIALYSYIILFNSVACMQGLKKPMFGLWMGLYRQITAPVVIFWSAIELLDMGIGGIWWSILFINYSAALFSFWYSRLILQRQPSD